MFLIQNADKCLDCGGRTKSSKRDTCRCVEKSTHKGPNQWVNVPSIYINWNLSEYRMCISLSSVSKNQTFTGLDSG